MTINVHPSKPYTCVGIDRASGKYIAVIGVLKDGVWSFKEVDPSDPDSFRGLKVDAVWIGESDMGDNQ